MNDRLKKWMPVALCCVPGVAVAAIVGVGAILGGAWLNGPLGLGLVALAVLACPLSMAAVTRFSKSNAAKGTGAMMADCCAPGQIDRLAALRSQREALEREVAEMETAELTTGLTQSQ